MKRVKRAVILTCLVLAAASGDGLRAQPQWSLDTVITTGANPTGIAITPDGSLLVVADNNTPGAVKLISTANYALTSVDLSGVENNPNEVAISPDGTTAYVATTHHVVIVDLAKKQVTGNFAAPCAGTTLYGLAATPDGQSLLLPDLSSGCTQQGLRTVSASSPSTSTFAGVSSSGALYDCAVTPDGSTALVTTFTSDTPKKITLSTQAVQGISGFSGSYSVAALHHSNEALIQGDSLKRVSLVSNKATKYLSDIYSTSLHAIAVTDDDRYAFVVGAFQKVIVDLAIDSVIQTFTAGATSVAVMPDGSRFFVTDSYNGTTRVYKKAASTTVDNTPAEQPSRFALLQNYPNPFNPTTVIGYQVPVTGTIRLAVYDLLGREVAVLAEGIRQPGVYQTTFNASGLPSGVYYARLSGLGETTLRKMILLR
jgi:DNA-binding beta-propeller fold protein YncE